MMALIVWAALVGRAQRRRRRRIVPMVSDVTNTRRSIRLMRFGRRSTQRLSLSIAAALLCVTHASAAGAEEIQVLSAVGMRQALVELAARFEQATGHKLTIAFDSGAMIVSRIERGDKADVVLVPQAAARQLVATGRAVANSVTDLASSRVGVAVRAGAPKPNIASSEALKQALLMAKSIARPDPALGGASGVHIQGVLERLGIAEAVASKTILSSRPDQEHEMPGYRLANGDADIALHQIQELVAVPGVTVVGPLPSELDGRFLFSAALVTGTSRGAAGEDLIAFLRTPEAKAVMRSKGMDPAGQ